MSRPAMTSRARRWLALGIAAFLLRAGLAVLTEHKPLFPPYYHQDAIFVDNLARSLADSWKKGLDQRVAYSPSQRVHTWLTAAVYLFAGPHPLALKLVNAVLGAVAIIALGAAVERAFGVAVSLWVCALVALWPSDIYFTSQNLKEAPIHALVWTALISSPPSTRNLAIRTASGMAALIAAGFLRACVTFMGSIALAVSWAWAACRPGAERRLCLLGLAAFLAVPALYVPLSRSLFQGALAPSVATKVSENSVIPKAYDGQSGIHSPLSPRGISEFRRLRQESDRAYAMKSAGRVIGTQIYSDARLESWLDVLLFLPKAAFHILFMPLPGLYPMEGKTGRCLAAGENALLLGIAILAAAGIARNPKTPARATFLVFFLLMTAGSSLLEFDLGSASRHKLLYMPMLYPFAVEEAARLFDRSGRTAPLLRAPENIGSWLRRRGS